MKKLTCYLLAIIMTVVMSLSISAESSQKNNEELIAKPESEKKSLESVSGDVNSEGQSIIDQNEKNITKESIEVISETRKALKLLGDGKTAESMKALEKIIGKLEILLAKHPDLTSIPIDSHISVLNTFTDLETVETIRKDTIKLLKDGDIQKARQLIDSLVSEIRIRTTYIPMGTYPQAIKGIVPMIDGGNVKAASHTLREALATLVVETEIVPLPPINAKHLLRKAQKLSGDRKEENKQEILDLIENARYQLKMAEALGYGDIEKDYETLHKLIDKTEDRISRNQSGEDIFDEVKEAVSKFTEKFRG